MSAPFVLSFVCFASGILLDVWIEVSGWTLLAAVLCAAASLRSQNYATCLAAQALLLLLLGLHYSQQQNTRYLQAPVRAFVRVHDTESHPITGMVLKTPEISQDFWVVRLRVLTIAGVPMEGVARITVSGDSNEYPVAGDRVETFARLRLPANFGAEGSFDYERYLQKEGIHVLGTVKSSQMLRVTDTAFGAATVFSRIRLNLIHRIQRVFSPRDAAVLRALWLDDRAGLNMETERALIDAGIFHVIAISGFHVAIVLAIGFLLLKRILPFRTALVVMGVMLLFYFLLLEGRSAITRSFLLYLSFAFAALRYEKIPWGNALGLAALLQIAINPLDLFDAGYHLTYLSTAAILFLAVPLCRRVRLTRKPYRFAWDFALTTLCVQLVLAPYQAWTFHRIPLSALAANWVAVPVSSVLIAMGMLMMPLPLAGSLLETPARFLIEVLMRSSFAWSGQWLVTALSPFFAAVCLYYALLAGALILRRTSLRVACGSLAFFCLITVFWHPPAGPKRELRIHVIDVGQGDAILLEYPDGTCDLVDGGGFWNPDALDVGQSVLIPYFSRMGVTRIHRVFLTHAHADHMNGLFSVLRYIPVEEVYVTRRPLATPGFQRLCVEWLQDLRTLKAGDVLEQSGVTLTVLAPVDSRKALKVANDDSLVMLVEYEGRRALLTGDAEKETEQHISRLNLPPIDVLKVPHHGSRTSSSEAWLSAIRPRTAVVSVGRNNWFGHPHPDVMQRYRLRHTLVYRTDRLGTIRIELSREKVSVDPYEWQ